MVLMPEAKERGDETGKLWADGLAKQKANLQALREREKELCIAPALHGLPWRHTHAANLTPPLGNGENGPAVARRSRRVAFRPRRPE